VTRPEGAGLQTVTARDLGEHGEAIATLEDGMTCFVHGLLPGESGRVRVVQRKPKYALGELVERTDTAPGRRPAPCAHFPECGGCQLQHWEESHQREWKRKLVLAALERIGGFEIEVPAVLPSPRDLGWRNKLSFPLRWGAGKALIGFYRQGTHHVVDVEACPVGAMPHAEILAAVKRWIATERISLYDEATGKGLLRHLVLRATLDGRRLLAVLVASRADPSLESFREVLQPPGKEPLAHGIHLNLQPKPGNAIFGAETRRLAGETSLTENLGGLAFQLSPLSFFQMNPAQAERLYEAALSQLPAGTRCVVDLYCGTGTLTLLAAARLPKDARIIGIEGHEGSVEDARRNAEANGLSHVSFRASDASRGLEKVLHEGISPEAILLNPPRTGAEGAVLDAILRSAAARVIYISCKPATLARDLKILGTGGFRLASVQPVDLFPQTTHVETVAVMVRDS